MITRRNMFFGLMSALAAPAIVRASSLMPVKALPPIPPEFSGWEIVGPDGGVTKFMIQIKYRIIKAAADQRLNIEQAA